MCMYIVRACLLYNIHFHYVHAQSTCIVSAYMYMCMYIVRACLLYNIHFHYVHAQSKCHVSLSLLHYILCLSISAASDLARVQVTSPTPEETAEDERKLAEPATPTATAPLSEALLSSPALKFITRRDLYTFLSNAGVSVSTCSRPSQFVHIRTIYKCMQCTQKRQRPGIKYHVRIVGGAIGKTLLLFPEARLPSHLVVELLAGRIICTTCVKLLIWLLS